MHACTRGLSFIYSLTTKDDSYTGNYNVKFELENGMPVAELWQSRSIKKISEFPEEEEALYLAGAEFEVTSHTLLSDGSVTSIKLRLIHPLHIKLYRSVPGKP